MIAFELVVSRVLRDSTAHFVDLSVRLSVRWSVGPSVGLLVRRSVTLYFFTVYWFFGYIAPAQMLH